MSLVSRPQGTPPLSSEKGELNATAGPFVVDSFGEGAVDAAGEGIGVSTRFCGGLVGRAVAEDALDGVDGPAGRVGAGEGGAAVAAGERGAAEGSPCCPDPMLISLMLPIAAGLSRGISLSGGASIGAAVNGASASATSAGVW